MTKAIFTKASVIRAVEAVKSAGLPVGMVEIGPDGTIRVQMVKQENSRGVPDAHGPKRFAG